ncbi:hypothetical protein E4T49_00148 [Aureobasidium sp. EXF-10728]|nr:hypothetical protein E4T49_00148 [Aureobasidium sp. EXF-10728]
MTGSIEGSAIDDGFETLTNAPDAWITGRYTAPPFVDYQHYVEAGDARSAVDDRCFTEYGAVEHARHVNKTTKPAKTEQKRHRSRQTSTKPTSNGKRRPSPSFRIRSKDGDSLVVSNPFVLRKPSRPEPRPESEQSSQTDDQSQYSSTTATRSRAFQIRIRGKNGEEAVHEIKRPLHFASQSRGTTLVGDESGREHVKYWSANQSSSKHKSKSGLATSPDFVVDSTTVASSTAGPVRMSGALPGSSPAPTTGTSRSRLLPPEKPASSMHDSVVSVSEYPSKSLSRSISDHLNVSSSKRSARASSQSEVIVVPDESLDGSVTTPFTSLSTHCIVSSRPLSSTPLAEPPEANDAASISDLITSQGSSNKIVTDAPSSMSSAPPSASSRVSSKRVITLTESSAQTQNVLDESRPATVSLSKHKGTKQEAYYNYKVPKDSLYSISTKDSKSSLRHQGSLAREKTVSPLFKNTGRSDGVVQHNVDAVNCTPSAVRPESPQELPQGYQPPPRSLFTQSSSARETTDGWIRETAHCIPLPSSRSASSESKTRRSSSTSNRQSTRAASQKSVQDDQSWNKPPSGAVASEWTTSKHSRHSSAEHSGAWEETAAWEDLISSSHHSKTSRTSRSRQSQSHKSMSSHHDAFERTEADNEEGSWDRHEKGSNISTRSSSSINIEEDLLHYLPPLSDNERLPPPMPMLTTIYEVSEPTPSNHPPSMFTQETTHFARPGAISPHPLSSVSSAATARKPPTNEPHRLEYQKPYVESKSSSSASSGAHDGSRLSRQSSRPRMLDQRAYHSAKEADHSRSSRKEVSGSAQSSRKSRASAKASGGGWKFW